MRIQNTTSNHATPHGKPEPGNRVNKETNALVFDRKMANNRATFTMKMRFEKGEKTAVKAIREWFCIGDQPISTETLEWSAENGIERVSMHNLSLQERGELRHNNQAGEFELCSPKTQMVAKVKNSTFKTSPATLLSLPLEVAKHWQQLQRGEKIIFDYSVLKVQAHTPVSIQAKKENGMLVVQLTPLSWFWRLVFGSTYMYFDQDKPVLRKIDGLIEPRDKKPNGRYLEYLAVIEFENAIDLSEFTDASSNAAVKGVA